MHVKRAKDYVREDGPGQSTVTSFAYWLTPEGLNNPIVAALLRDALGSSTDDEFAEAFDGATKVEAAEFLAAYELCAMPFWGADELAQAIHNADSGRDQTQARRSVSLAQTAGELPEVFQPREGVEWAMRRGYLFGAHADFLGVARGRYGHPHGPLADAAPSYAGDGKESGSSGLTTHSVTPTGRPHTAWALAFEELLPRLQSEKGHRPTPREVIKYLKAHGKSHGIADDGGPDELFWRTGQGDRKRVTAKTVSNKLGTYFRAGGNPD